MTDLFLASNSSPDFEARAVVPARELGAYEAIWLHEGTSFKTIADMFRAQPRRGSVRLRRRRGSGEIFADRTSAIRAAGIKHFGIRVHGAGEYPEKLRDAQHPVELLYFQGNWDSPHHVASRSLVQGLRAKTDLGERRGSPGCSPRTDSRLFLASLKA